MKVIISHQFIAKDKPEASRKFRKNLLSEIRKIPNRSLSYRKSDFFDNDKIREIIFKGYRIVFEIKPNHILVFGFHKWEDSLNM